ncbi:MAG TPA: hypothetical protein VKA23_02085 [Mariprofundaceae bacterium]|nr:hypothetical protein [Mariprofundaceae bacterium]
MKLLDEFRKQIGELGELRYVWLTSFNISIEFVETFLLPVVLGMDTPRNRMDYEHFQLALTDKKIDFRIFCDRRFMEAGQNKRTSIPVHGISPAVIEWFSKESLFHPKVIYLEDVNGKKILGTGSANLTIGGWGRNQEVFSFKDISTKEQYSSAKRFFDILADNAGISERLPERRGLPREEGGWSFVHSFQDTMFLTQLFEGTKSHELMVWSPYLPKDLPAFVQKLKQAVEKEDLEVHLVPDRIQGAFIRTPLSPELTGLVEDRMLTFYDNPSVRDDNVELCHSKVWKIGGKLAIGSWNFTGPGSNLPDEAGEWNERSNIEAGFILDDSSSWRNAVAKPITMDSANFASDALLVDEGLDVPKQLPFDIRVNFDWGEQRYDFAGKWHEGEEIQEYALRVPGISRPIALCWMPSKLVLKLKPEMLANPTELLSEHRFEVIQEGKIIYRGLITETGLSFRRAQAFTSLGELLDAFVFGGDPGPVDAIPFRLPVNENGESTANDSIDDAQAEWISQEQGISYFRLFQATQQYSQNIEAIASVGELNRWVFTRPGCLLELAEKTKEKIASSEPSVFNWFLAHEVNMLSKHASKKRRILGNTTDSLSKVRWDELGIPLPRLPKGVEKGHVELFMKECGYA